MSPLVPQKNPLPFGSSARQNEAMARALPICLAAVAAMSPSLSHAYRPFDSTDASVADPGEFELEFGTALSEASGQKSLTLPVMVANYGLSSDRELVFDASISGVIESGSENEPTLYETALSLKQVHRRGRLQGEDGISVATECSALLPTLNGDDQIGAELGLIASQQWQTVTLHANAGVAFSREHQWEESLGAIVEGPEEWPVRPVAEITIEWVEHDSPVHAVLAGVIWDAKDVLSVDVGVRYASGGQPDAWEVRAGFTWTH